MKWSYGVTTVPQRSENLFPRTLDSLAQGGFNNPWVFLDRAGPSDLVRYQEQFGSRVAGIVPRAGQVAAYANWLLALWELFLRDPEADRYALFQDDVICYRNLRLYLEGAPYPPDGYLNLYTHPDYHQRRPPERARSIDGAVVERKWTGWFHVKPTETPKTGLGALGLVFSREAVIALLSAPHLVRRLLDPSPRNRVRRTRLIDGAVVEAMREVGYREYVHHPSLVQHLGDESTIRPGRPAQPHAPAFRGEEYDALSLLPQSVTPSSSSRPSPTSTETSV